MSVVDTGFVSEAQETYLRLNEPELYKVVLKKHGSFNSNKNKRNINVVSNSSSLPQFMTRGRKR